MENMEKQKKLEEFKMATREGIFDYLFNWSANSDIFMTRPERTQIDNLVKEKGENNLSDEEKKQYENYKKYQKSKFRKNWFTGIIMGIYNVANRDIGLMTEDEKTKLRTRTDRLRKKVEKIVKEEGRFSEDDMREGEELGKEALKSLFNNEEEFSNWLEERQKEKS